MRKLPDLLRAEQLASLYTAHARLKRNLTTDLEVRDLRKDSPETFEQRLNEIQAVAQQIRLLELRKGGKA